MQIYHGSNYIIEKPVFNFGKIYNDYGKGDPFVVWGKSGIEITYDILEKDKSDYLKALEEKGRNEALSKEYWAGWALAYYQWLSGKTFQEINKKVPFTSIINMYHPYHEMDILQFCDRMEELENR